MLTTQVSIRDHQDNLTDIVFKGLTPAAMATIVTDFAPLPESRTGERAATFDIVLGKTALEDDNGVLRGGLGKKTWDPNRRR